MTDSGCRGLELRRTEEGLVFTARYVWRGKRRRMYLGVYGRREPGMTLAKAGPSARKCVTARSRDTTRGAAPASPFRNSPRRT